METAAQLRKKADELERQERENLRQTKAARVKAARYKSAELLIAELAKRDVPAGVKEAEWGGVFVCVEKDPGLSIDCCVTTNYSDEVTEVGIKTGSYGERPQMFQAKTPEDLPLSKIAANVIKRLEARAVKEAEQAARRETYLAQARIRRSNEQLAERLNSLAGHGVGIIVYPSSERENAVDVRIDWRRDVPADEAEALVVNVKNVLAERTLVEG